MILPFNLICNSVEIKMAQFALRHLRYPRLIRMTSNVVIVIICNLGICYKHKFFTRLKIMFHQLLRLHQDCPQDISERQKMPSLILYVMFPNGQVWKLISYSDKRYNSTLIQQLTSINLLALLQGGC